jgi:hypothetical protein
MLPTSNDDNTMEEGAPGNSEGKEESAVVSSQNASKTTELQRTRRNILDDPKPSWASPPVPPNKQTSELPLNIKGLLKDYFEGDLLKEPPEFTERSSKSLRRINMGFPIQYRHKETGENLYLDNFPWISATKRQSVAVVGGNCLPEPVIIVTAAKWSVEVRIWRGVGIIDATACQIEKIWGITIVWSKRSTAPAQLSTRPRSTHQEETVPRANLASKQHKTASLLTWSATMRRFQSNAKHRTAKKSPVP